MQISHVDRVNLKTWTLSILCCAASFVNVVVFSIAAHFPGAGFPCYYPRMIDFDNLNLSNYNAIHHLTPHLYLDATQLVMYVILTESVFFCIVVYYLVCWVRIFFRKDGGGDGKRVNQSTQDISCLGDTASCFAFVLTVDTFQVFVLSLAFRLPSMVAFAKCLYFISLTGFTVTCVTNYESRERNAFALSKLHPKLQGTVQYRTAVINMTQFLLGLATMVLALSLALGFGNSFFVKTGHMVFAAMAVFGIVACVYFSIIEAVLVHYVKVQFGFHAGSVFSVCAAMYPIITYERLNASEFARDINIGLTVLLLLCIGFTIIRIVRFLIRRNRRYRALPAETDEIRSLNSGDAE
ncbi:pR100 [rat cytomegalovirus strain Maastricht]|uniref:PR100 n=1 Tax=Rat cytomegalovirus (strain Maastricht) TaxID=79700 RepID=Q9DWA0_RCMVM|nr:pR100 [rat cytomegalovirus strain Maastricht]AAF99190.1 pR100 [rat cytomegalovirus strain Maastricht]WEG72021.1 envelope glycoprotein M [Murid betaherpesvirus 2]